MSFFTALSFYRLIIVVQLPILPVKTYSGNTIHPATFLSLDDKFVSFAQLKISFNKNKSVFSWSTSESKRETSNLDKF